MLGSTMTLFSVILGPVNWAETAHRHHLMLCYRTPCISLPSLVATFQSPSHEVVFPTAHPKHSTRPFIPSFLHSAMYLESPHCAKHCSRDWDRAKNQTDRTLLFQGVRRRSMVTTRETMRHMKEIKQRNKRKEWVEPHGVKMGDRTAQTGGTEEVSPQRWCLSEEEQCQAESSTHKDQGSVRLLSLLPGPTMYFLVKSTFTRTPTLNICLTSSSSSIPRRCLLTLVCLQWEPCWGSLARIPRCFLLVIFPLPTP